MSSRSTVSPENARSSGEKHDRAEEDPLSARRVIPRHTKTQERNSTAENKETEEQGEVPVSTVDLITKKLWSNDETIVYAALTKLADLCISGNDNYAENKKEIWEAGGHASIIGVMHKFKESAAIQKAGLRALINTSHLHNAMRNAIGKVGGIEKTVSAMEMFPADEDLQKNGCGAICNLIELEKNAENFIVQNKIPAIVAAMKAFPFNKVLQHWGCLSLKKLCQAKWKDQVKAADTGRVVVAAMHNHYDNANIKDLAEKVFKFL